MSNKLLQPHQVVIKLVNDYESHRKQYLLPGYSEAQARQDFIDKLLTALGWDVSHNKQTNPFEQEVKVERNVDMGHTQRRADYAFCLGPNFRDVRFYVEAKKPSSDLRTKDNYFQAIRYGWNSQTPVVFLTNFEELHVLDCRYRPDIDTSIECAVLTYHFSDYRNADKFAEIYWLLSREAQATGSLERFAEGLPKRRGKAVQRGLFKGGFQDIDEAFLEDLDNAREALARSLKARNVGLDGEALTEISQRILDRIVFLRFLEDKLIETTIRVADFGNKGTVWGDFLIASRRLDSVYNGIVFKHHQLIDTGLLDVDEKVFGDICEDFSHSNSPYNFDIIPIHILGSIYERFLGKVIVTTDKRARLEEKPEVRKAGGVYYTPNYIVTYIVRNTVGKLIEGKSPAQIADMRFADIACGSGSFLLGIFDYLIQYHRAWYNANPTKGKKEECLIDEQGVIHVTLQQKRKILLNNVFGVDIDSQAVEVAQLSLYLKLLEEETTATARFYQHELHETLLPPLNTNIVCGNSLIGTDILEGELFPADEERRVNPMNFEDCFPSIMLQGGFDAIVGNPPYVNAWELYESQPNVREFLNASDAFKTADRHWDMYILFLERANQLTKVKGRFAYIIPFSYAIQKYGMASREWLLKTCVIESIVDFRQIKVFKDVPVITIVPVIVKQKPRSTSKIVVFKPSPDFGRGKTYEVLPSHDIAQQRYLAQHECMIRLDLSDKAVSLVEKMERGTIRLGDLCYVNYGAQMSSKIKGRFGKDHVIRPKKESSTCKHMVGGRELYRYQVRWSGRFVEYALANQMYGPRWPEFFELPKIMIRDITGTHRVESTLDREGYYCDHTILCALRKTDVAEWKEASSEDIELSAKYELALLTGLVASKAISAYFYLVLTGEGVRTGGGFHTYPETIRSFPIPLLNWENPKHVASAKKMTSLVEELLEAKAKEASSVTDRDKAYWLNRCVGLDNQIDRIAFDLYSLDQEDIVEVERACS